MTLALGHADGALAARGGPSAVVPLNPAAYAPPSRTYAPPGGGYYPYPGVDLGSSFPDSFWGRLWVYLPS